MAKHTGMLELENTIGRLRSQLGTAHRGYKKWYEKHRLLENAVRDAVREIHPDTRHAKIQALAHRIPKHPRKKWGWRSGG